MKSKLNLDPKVIDSARSCAARIAESMQEFIDRHTTVSTERTILRLLGVDGIDEVETPLPNVVVDQIKDAGGLPRGVAYWMGNAMIQTGKSPQEIAEEMAAGNLEITKLPLASAKEAEEKIMPVVLDALKKIREQTEKRNQYLETIGEGRKPYLYVIVATGNIYEDVVQAQAAARQGADIIAVIRTTAQSLLDYVPYGPTTEGFGGTYATQENFRIMRKALDEVGEEVGRYIRLCNYSSGMCMPEIAAMGALERLDVMLNDALYGILFRDINMQRTLVDQYFSRVIIGYCDIIFNSGEDNYLTTDDAYEAAHTVLASQFINEQFAVLANVKEEQMGLGHAFEMDPDIENGFLYELSQAIMAKEIFPMAEGADRAAYEAEVKAIKYVYTVEGGKLTSVAIEGSVNGAPLSIKAENFEALESGATLAIAEADSYVKDVTAEEIAEIKKQQEAEAKAAEEAKKAAEIAATQEAAAGSGAEEIAE